MFYLTDIIRQRQQQQLIWFDLPADIIDNINLLLSQDYKSTYYPRTKKLDGC
jgi:hypothetical protein